ncbi:MAG: hypothetical protein AAF478_03510 [Pseudomonadota bacterium]
MRDLLDRYSPVRNTDDNSGGGTGEDNNSGGGTGDHNNSGGTTLYRPEGVPETMFGETNEETIDKMVSTINGFRSKDNNRPKAPETIDGYALDEATIPDEIKPFLQNLESDPVWDSIRVKALESEITSDQFSSFVQNLVSEWASAGLLEPPLDIAAERKALIPETAQYLSEAEQTTAVDARMKENFDWMESAAAKFGVSEDMAKSVMENLGDTAHGHAFVELFRNMAEKKANPLLGGGKGDVPLRQDLAQREADPRNDPNSAKYDRSFREETDRMWQKLDA